MRVWLADTIVAVFRLAETVSARASDEGLQLRSGSDLRSKPPFSSSTIKSVRTLRALLFGCIPFRGHGHADAFQSGPPDTIRTAAKHSFVCGLHSMRHLRNIDPGRGLAAPSLRTDSRPCGRPSRLARARGMGRDRCRKPDVRRHPTALLARWVEDGIIARVV